MRTVFSGHGLFELLEETGMDTVYQKKSPLNHDVFCLLPRKYLVGGTYFYSGIWFLNVLFVEKYLYTKSDYID